jgi:hypothetical protein
MIEEIYQTKKQIRVYDENQIPDSELVRSIIKKAYNLVPSKQNLIPFQIHVFGPDCRQEKEHLFKLSTQTTSNVSHNITVFAPYVLVLTNRLVDDPNESVLIRLKKGHTQSACDENKFMDKGSLIQSSIEVGMYSSILTGLCLENNLEISYLKCFKSWYGKNSDIGEWKSLPCIKYSPLLLMCIGYRDKERNWDMSKEKAGTHLETKPDINNIIKFY